MPGNRVLTWLFIAASVVLDIVLLVAAMANRDVYQYHQVLAGLALGQVGALAIWTVIGSVHRLARGACLVIATGVLALVATADQSWNFQRWLALLGIYAIVVVAAVAVILFIRRSLAERSAGHGQMRTSLIELFGWTIVVAIASFGARYMSFQVIENGLSQIPTTVVLLAIPVLAELLYRRLFRPSQLLLWAAFVIVCTAAGYGVATRKLTPIVFATQASYLACWMIVRSQQSEPPAATQADPPDDDTNSDHE